MSLHDRLATLYPEDFLALKIESVELPSSFSFQLTEKNESFDKVLDNLEKVSSMANLEISDIYFKLDGPSSEFPEGKAFFTVGLADKSTQESYGLDIVVECKYDIFVIESIYEDLRKTILSFTQRHL